MKKTFGSLICLLFLFIYMNASAATVATGGKGGLYHTKVFNAFAASLKRVSEGEMEAEYYKEGGTDGSIANLKSVNSGKADIAFVQLGTTVVEDSSNAETMGIFMYEIAHLAAPKKGKVDSCGDLESGKKYSMGYNFRSGSAVTRDVMIEVDKGYAKAQPQDFDKGGKAINAMNQGKLDSFFFVSGPGSKNIKRIIKAPGIEFKKCWDGDFDDFKVGGNKLYTKVKVGKKQGYPSNFVTFRVPAVVIVNKNFLADNEDAYDWIYDAVEMTFATIKAEVGGAKYYP